MNIMSTDKSTGKVEQTGVRMIQLSLFVATLSWQREKIHVWFSWTSHNHNDQKVVLLMSTTTNHIFWHLEP